MLHYSSQLILAITQVIEAFAYGLAILIASDVIAITIFEILHRVGILGRIN